MCGLAGVIFGRKRRRAEEREYLAWLFTRLLVMSEGRAPPPRASPGTTFVKRRFRAGSGLSGVLKGHDRLHSVQSGETRKTV